MHPKYTVYKKSTRLQKSHIRPPETHPRMDGVAQDQKYKYTSCFRGKPDLNAVAVVADNGEMCH